MCRSFNEYSSRNVKNVENQRVIVANNTCRLNSTDKICKGHTVEVIVWFIIHLIFFQFKLPFLRLLYSVSIKDCELLFWECGKLKAKSTIPL